MATLCCSPRSKAAGQTRLPTFSIRNSDSSAGLQSLQRVADHVAVEMAALAGVDLQRRDAGCPDAFGVVGGLLVALDDADRHFSLQQFDGPDQQRGLARTGARNEVERQDSPFVETLAVGRGIGVVLGEDVLLDLHHARLAHARRMGVRRAGAVIQIAGDAVFVVMVFVTVLMGMFALMDMGMAVLAAIGMGGGVRSDERDSSLPWTCA